MATDQLPPRETMPELDGVRALAVLAVMAHHGSYGLVKGGFLGVDLFFVLSGFLITLLLRREWERHGRISLGMFYIRRILRLVPPLVVALLLAYYLGKFDWRQGAAPILAFYANYVDPLPLGSMTHAWSLAVEEQFYLVWPLLFLLAMRLSGVQAAAAVALVAFVAAIAFRLYCLSAGMDVELIYRHGIARADSLAAGCLIALIDRGGVRGGSTLLMLGFLAAFAVLCLVATHTHWLMLGIGYSLFAVAAALFLAALVAAPATSLIKRAFAAPLAVWLGRRSYAIYLFHVPVFIALEAFRERQSALNLILVTLARVAITLALAELSYRLVESRALALKRYFYPAPRETGEPGRARAAG